MRKNPSNAFCCFPNENKFDVLEEISEITGLSKKDLLSFRALGKCSFAHVDFEKGSMEITVSTYCFKGLGARTFEVTAAVSRGKISTSIKHQLNHADLALYSAQADRKSRG